MKKNLFMVAAVALMVFTACNKEEFNASVDAQAGTVEFVAGFDVDTKTTLDETKTKTLWAEDDKISINGFVFEVSQLIDGGTSAKFVNHDALVDFKAPYTAYYPANVTEIPAVQTAYANNFDPDAVIEMAESDDHNLSFQNVASLLKFEVAAECQTVTLTSDNALAGAGSTTVTINGPFAPGSEYFAAVLPGEKANFTVKVDGYPMRSAPSVNIAASAIVNMKSLDVPGDWIMSGELGEVHMTKSETYTSLYVAKNVALGTGKSFKFQNKEKDKVIGAWGQSGTVDCKDQVNTWYGSDATNSYAANISVSTSGNYDVYFSPENYDFLIIKTGVETIDSKWEIVGWINGNDSWGGGSGYVLKTNYITNELSIEMNLTSSDYFKILKNKNWTPGSNGGWIGAPGEDGSTKDYAIAVGATQSVSTHHSYNNHKAQFHLTNNGKYKIIVNVSDDAYTSATVKISRIS